MVTVGDVPTAGPRPDRHGHRAAEPGPLIFGHRGAAGYRPEHTLTSYELAIRFGVDVIEPDLVITRDGVLVARHEPELSATTDVAAHPEFAGRRTTKVLDGVPTAGWFTEDFTLTELRTLRAQERIPQVRPRNTIYDGRYPVPTFQEVIDLAKRASHRYGREIGIAPEIKHPTYFREQGMPLEPPLVRALTRNGLNRAGATVWVQSFEVGNLIRLRSMLHVRLVQLLSASGAPYDFVAAGDGRTYADLVTPAGLREIARYADAMGPDKTRSFHATPQVPCSHRPAWSRTRTAPASTWCRTPSATRTLSCRSTSGTPPTRLSTATPSPNTPCSGPSASTDSSATTRTPPGRPGTSTSHPVSSPSLDEAGRCVTSVGELFTLPLRAGWEPVGTGRQRAGRA